MWVYRSGDYEKDQVVLYEYTPTRGSEHPKRFLSGFSGYVQVDGYEVYHGIEGITCAGCWFHLRRKFVEADKSGNKTVPYYSLAAQGLSFIKRLNDIEIRCKDFTPQERKEVRIKESAPIINDFFSWVSKVTSEVLPQSLIGKALAYANKQKPYLLTYLTDGRINFSSNAVERSIRPFASHRNAWLFCDSPRGAEASAICYSIVETAKLNALKPNEYLKFLLLELSQLSSEDSIVDFLPWAPSVPEHYRLPDVPAPNN